MKVKNYNFATPLMSKISLLNPQEYIHRASVNLNGKPLAGCEVCWTCTWFSYSDLNCNFFLGRQADGSIEHPDIFRCSYWEEKK